MILKNPKSLRMEKVNSVQLQILHYCTKVRIVKNKNAVIPRLRKTRGGDAILFSFFLFGILSFLTEYL